MAAHPVTEPNSAVAGLTAQMSSTGEITAIDRPALPGLGDLYAAFANPGLPFAIAQYARPPAPAPRKVRQPLTKQYPPELEVDSPSSNAEYTSALANSTLTFSPQALGFLPSNYWLAVDVTFGDLVVKFFQRKNGANCRFPHKLFNALLLVDSDPGLFRFIGVRWLTDRVLKVDKLIFGRLLGIMSVDGGLFHHQGNFRSHGFAELGGEELTALRPAYDLSDVDMDRVRLLCHEGNAFTKGCDEEAVSRCRWVSHRSLKL
jgi:hypothetical protein